MRSNRINLAATIAITLLAGVLAGNYLYATPYFVSFARCENSNHCAQLWFPNYPGCPQTHPHCKSTGDAVFRACRGSNITCEADREVYSFNTCNGGCAYEQPGSGGTTWILIYPIQDCSYELDGCKP
jgi:hypothetical protein